MACIHEQVLKYKRDHPPSVLDTLYAELLFIPALRSVGRYAQVGSYQYKSTEYSVVKHVPRRCCNDRKRQVDETLGEVVRANQIMEDRVIGEGVFLQPSQVCVSVILHARS